MVTRLKLFCSHAMVKKVAIVFLSMLIAYFATSFSLGVKHAQGSQTLDGYVKRLVIDPSDEDADIPPEISERAQEWIDYVRNAKSVRSGEKAKILEAIKGKITELQESSAAVTPDTEIDLRVKVGSSKKVHVKGTLSKLLRGKKFGLEEAFTTEGDNPEKKVVSSKVDEVLSKKIDELENENLTSKEYREGVIEHKSAFVKALFDEFVDETETEPFKVESTNKEKKEYFTTTIDIGDGHKKRVTLIRTREKMEEFDGDGFEKSDEDCEDDCDEDNSNFKYEIADADITVKDGKIVIAPEEKKEDPSAEDEGSAGTVEIDKRIEELQKKNEDLSKQNEAICKIFEEQSKKHEEKLAEFQKSLSEVANFVGTQAVKNELEPYRATIEKAVDDLVQKRKLSRSEGEKLKSEMKEQAQCAVTDDPVTCAKKISKVYEEFSAKVKAKAGSDSERERRGRGVRSQSQRQKGAASFVPITAGEWRENRRFSRDDG